jgi:nucleoside 2-deoxyribosyltransferase
VDRMGHIVSSTWHNAPLEKGATLTDDQRVLIARRDVCEVRASDAVLLVAGEEKYSGGKFVEAGIAIGCNKPVYILGRRENVLLWIDGCMDAAYIGVHL